MPEIRLSKEEEAKLAIIKNELDVGLKAQVDAGLKTSEDAMNVLTKAMENIESQLKDLKSKAGAVTLGLDEQDSSKFSFAKTAYALATREWKHAGFEKEILDATMQNAQTVNPASAGGVMVPTEISSSLIEMLRAESVLMSMGMQTLNLSGVGKFELPRQLTGSTAYWLGELDTITESSLTFDNVTLDPKKVAGIVRMSRELIADANQSIEAIVRKDLATQLALAVDDKGIQGDGTNDTPVGILNTVGIGTFAVGANGDPCTYQTFDELIGILEDENALRGRLGYLSNPRAFRALRNQAVAQYSGQAEGQPLIMPIVSDAVLEGHLGYKLGKTTQIAKDGAKGTGTDLTKVIFGNFEDLIMGQWGGLELAASDVAGDNFTRYSVQMRAIMRLDFAVRQPKSFAVATDVSTSAVVV